MFDEQKRQAEIDKREAQLKEWNAEIDKLMAKVQQANADAKKDNFARLETYINELTDARDSASAELQRLKESVESNWTNFMEKADSAFQAAAEKFHDFASKHS
jgi:hypothetical protein